MSKASGKLRFNLEINYSISPKPTQGYKKMWLKFPEIEEIFEADWPPATR